MGLAQDESLIGNDDSYQELFYGSPEFFPDLYLASAFTLNDVQFAQSCRSSSTTLAFADVAWKKWSYILARRSLKIRNFHPGVGLGPYSRLKIKIFVYAQNVVLNLFISPNTLVAMF